MSPKIRSGYLSWAGWFHRLMNVRIIPNMLEKGQRFPRFGSSPTFWPQNCHGTCGCHLDNQHVMRLKVYQKSNLLPSWTWLVLIIEPISYVKHMSYVNVYVISLTAILLFPRLCPAHFPPVSRANYTVTIHQWQESQILLSTGTVSTRLLLSGKYLIFW